MKTKRAYLTFGRKEMITCTTTGEKDIWGKEIWVDAEGNKYELSYARHAKTYAFIPRKGVFIVHA